MVMVSFKESLFNRLIKHDFILDTNASYAGNWLAGFYKNTLKSNPKFLKDTLVLITFDEVRLLNQLPHKL